MIHYLDNSATTKPSDEAVRAAEEAILRWGNPSSVHSLGREAASLLSSSRKQIARSLGLSAHTDDRIVFTASGTEANNIAILGAAHAKKRDKDRPGTVIISAGEHPSVDNPARLLESEGYDVVRVPTENGVLNLEYLEEALKNCTSPVVLAAFMLVNNETGAVYDVKAASSLVKSKYRDAVVHCDAVQGYMKVKFTPLSLGADTLSVSAHKIHSIRGAAALYISAESVKRKNITAVMPGGGQEWGIRSGTENLVSIASFAAAADIGRSDFAANREKLLILREKLDKGLSSLDVVRIVPKGEYVPNIESIILPSIRSETMLNYLSSREVYVSAGSACAANSKKKSAALEAFGLAENDADSAIRISLSPYNTEEDIDALLSGLGDGIKTLQRKR